MIHERRCVAIYSIATNKPKNNKDVPRSRSNTKTARETSQAITNGPRSFNRGSSIPRNLVRTTASESLFATR